MVPAPAAVQARRAALLVVLAGSLAAIAMLALPGGGLGRARVLEGDDDFSTADRAMNWNLDAPTKHDEDRASWYAAGTGDSAAQESGDARRDLDGPSASDGSSASWANAGTYDPAGLASGDGSSESQQLKKLRDTLIEHGAYKDRATTETLWQVRGRGSVRRQW